MFSIHYLSEMVILFLLFLSAVINAEESVENSTKICDRCTCTQSDDAQILTVDCINRDLKHILAEWPAHNTTIKATFAKNNITTLETLPPTDASVEVVLSECNIKYLRPGLFADAKNIKFVDLSHNLLTADEVSSDKFKGPYNNTIFEPIALEDLNLAYNQIHSLGKNVFEHLPNLKRLNLEGNDFTVLDIHTQLALSSVSGLQSLNLANNELTELVKNAIDNFKNLTELNLSKNSLDFVPGSLGHIGKTLEILILDDNPIIELIDESFLGLENINELSANDLTKLKYVNANTFVPMLKLKKLSLSNNSLLKDIDREAFAINKTLDEFYLNNNSLYRIDYKLLRWSQLKVFEFKDNSLQCSCDLYNITVALSRDITRNEDGPYCVDPRNDRTIPVFYLKSDICAVKGRLQVQKQYIQYHFTMMRMVLIVLSVVLMMAAFIAAVLGYIRYRKYQRNSNYPYASQILYNPISTNGSRF